MAASCTASARTASSWRHPPAPPAYSLSAGAPFSPQTQRHHAGAHVPAHPEQPPHRAGCGQRSAAAGLARQPGRRHAGELRRPGHPGGPPGDEILIKKSSHKLHLVHPLDYSYFHVLRNKLWLGQQALLARQHRWRGSTLAAFDQPRRCRLECQMHPVSPLPSPGTWQHRLWSASEPGQPRHWRTRPHAHRDPSHAAGQAPCREPVSIWRRIRSQMSRAIWPLTPHDDGKLLATDAPHQIILAYLGHQHPGHIANDLSPQP